MTLDEIRPIVVRSHIAKIMEKAILAKIKEEAPHLLETRMYQTGFKEGKSTAIHASRLLQEVHGRKKRKFNLLVDLQKAYDSVDREILFEILKKRARSDKEEFLISLIEDLHRTSLIEVGTSTVVAEMGLPQGSVLSPLLFNIYLEEALRTSPKLEQVRNRGDLLAFADDMLLMSNSRSELEEIINELASLELSYNLRLNKKKSEILTAEDAEEIAGVKCRKSVKYLGVKVTVDRSEQRKSAKEQIHRNLNALRWKLKGGEPNVVQQLTCCLARSLLIYIGTPMVVAGLWRRQDIDSLEAGLYRKILFVGNGVSNKAILNTMLSIRLAGEAIQHLAKGAWEESRRQTRLTSYF